MKVPPKMPERPNVRGQRGDLKAGVVAGAIDRYGIDSDAVDLRNL